ncbi:hypothetical protein [Deinococcus arcticus]|uniref:Uncharacterized protein n=1 Tax=Deinococcus arcticus TaxID=2136176 RepID=A0A2T3W5M5_9DEIO|nr:hypothetical protein [Deinococcus arcticus]PTA67200.1 hypothetical protein C8263_13980 [Deinococcus arcticus]
MKPPVTPRVHGVIDYVACAGLLVLPRLLGLSPAARARSQALAAGYLALTVITDFPLAVRRTVPFPWHGRAELLSLPLVLLSARGAKTNDRRYFAGVAAMVLTAFLSTDWGADPDR